MFCTGMSRTVDVDLKLNGYSEGTCEKTVLKLRVDCLIFDSSSFKTSSHVKFISKKIFLYYLLYAKVKSNIPSSGSPDFNSFSRFPFKIFFIFILTFSNLLSMYDFCISSINDSWY